MLSSIALLCSCNFFRSLDSSNITSYNSMSLPLNRQQLKCKETGEGTRFTVSNFQILRGLSILSSLAMARCGCHGADVQTTTTLPPWRSGLEIDPLNSLSSRVPGFFHGFISPNPIATACVGRSSIRGPLTAHPPAQRCRPPPSSVLPPHPPAHRNG